MEVKWNRLRRFKREEEGISAISLMISLIVAVMVIVVIFFIISSMKTTSIDRIEIETVEAQDNCEWDGSVLYQLSGDRGGKATINITVLDSDNNGVRNAALTITGPGFSSRTDTTDKFGKASITVTFDLPTTAGDFITIKADSGDSGLGGGATIKIPVNVK